MIKRHTMKKHIIIIITALLLLTSCTQQITDEEILQRAEEIEVEQATDAPTIEPTIEPTAGPVEYTLEPFESYYADLVSNTDIDDEEWEMLRHVYDQGIILKFDDSFGNYSFSTWFIFLSENNYDDAIDVCEYALYRLNPYETEATGDFIKKYLHVVHNSYTFDNYDGTPSSGRSGAYEIILAYGTQGMQTDGAIDVNKGAGNFISEFANIIIRQNSKEISDYFKEFNSYNEEVIDNDLWNAGYLDHESRYDEVDDLAEYIAGIFTNYNNFWEAYFTSYLKDENKTVFYKGNVVIKILAHLNTEWTPEFTFQNYCEYSTYKNDGISYNSWETFKPYFEG